MSTNLPRGNSTEVSGGQRPGVGQATDAPDTLREVTRRIAELCDPEKIILFGSAARGTADRRSDVDLLVVARWQGRRHAAIVRLDRALSGLRLACDIVLLSPEEYELDRHIPGTIARPASQEGRVLYERP